jgi:hypothetical protein
MKTQCATCPFREGVAQQYKDVQGVTIELILGLDPITQRAASRICHSTGKNNAFHKDTGKPERICRGARNVQLMFLHAINFLPEPTDKAWVDKCRELGIKPDNGRLNGK